MEMMLALIHMRMVAVRVHMKVAPVHVHMMVKPGQSQSYVLLLHCRMLIEQEVQMHVTVALVQIHKRMQLVPKHMKVVLPDLIHSNQHYSHEQLQLLPVLQVQVL
ncbi:Os02g0192150 [Oryza sativa Japonica Group]|jgi:hypothetical protein|uniref:Os02g0192150 protein n=1 Tax=Oryza sativa subsp. japonica TaxID=39947 RepID=A0A0P0VFQ2_ORYSJ|nr:hypothetical protein EE612_009448 [Oryza sativa]BAS77412.1 Os02g0192150 [Oryza sativa Japonica Group]